MKYRNFNIPLGVPIMGTPKKNWVGAAIGAVGGLISGLASSSVQSGYTKEQQRLQSKLNREEMSYSSGLQRANSDYMMNKMYSNNVSGMKNAGLNPATANGTSPATPSLGTPSTGGTGPSAGMPNFDLVGAAKEGEMLDAQIENIKADTKNKESQSGLFDADARLKEIQASPAFVKAGLDKLSGEAQLAWCQSDLTAKQSIECMSRVQKIGKDMQLSDAQINNLQAMTAKAHQDIQESISRVSLNKVEQYFKITGASLNKALAAQARANAAEAHERINSGLYKSEVEKNYSQAFESQANETLLRQKGFTEEQIRECKKIEAKLLEFDQKVNEQYGAIHKGSIQWATDLFGVLTGGILSGVAPHTGKMHTFKHVSIQ